MIKAGLIGNPLMHSLSPIIHKMLFDISKIDGEYKLYECKTFEEAQEVVFKLDCYNVTLPFKKDVFNMLSINDESAKKFGAVNCVFEKTGFNTDFYGFMCSINGFASLSDVLIIGAGGVGTMLAKACDGNVTVAVRDVKKVAEYYKSIKNITVVDIFDIPKQRYSLIVNATPLGMFPNIEKCPISEEILKCGQAVFDTIYNPLKTKLIHMAEENNIPAKNGLEMLVMQAVKSHQIWYNGIFKKDDISKIYKCCEDELRS